MDTHHSILSALGGPRLVARRLGLSEKTVLAWSYRNSIPTKHWKPVLRFAAECGVELGAEDLLVTSEHTQNAVNSNRREAA